MLRSSVYKVIRDRAKCELPWLRVVDLQKGQFSHKQDNDYPLPRPALLIEIIPGKWENAEAGTQIATEAIISLTIYTDALTDTFNGSENEDETLELLDNQDVIFQKFEGFCDENRDLFSPLNRVSEKTSYATQMIITKVDFTTELYDALLKTEQTVHRPKLLIS